MKKSETIDFQHRELLLDNFKQLNLPISDYTFANIFLFRSISAYEFLTTDCGLFISGCNRQGQNFIMPLNDLRKCDQQTFEDLLDKQTFFFPIPEEWLAFFPEDKFAITCEDSESDYIYLTEKMASFRGNQFTRHRNHLNQFFSAYNPRVEAISKNNEQQAMAVLQAWQDDSVLEINKTDYEQCREALEKFSALALWGTLYYIENKPAGFIIGEKLNTETFVLHFAKASKKYHGIYEFMFNDTARRLLSSYKFLNLEEDMGNKNLRRTKGSYGPETLLKKYRVSLKNKLENHD
jgi:uncharacterized protein